MAKGNKKADKWAIVINAKKEADPIDTKQQLEQQAKAKQQFERLQNLLLNYKGYRNVFTIIHDKDRLQDGTPKRIHCHVYLESETTTLSSLLLELTELLEIEKEQISIDSTNSTTLIPQYLTHKNNTEKTQYRFEEVKASDIDEYRKRWESEYTPKVDTEKANQQVLINSRTITEVMLTLGLEFANKNKALFQLIKQEQDLDYTGLCNRLDEANRHYADLFDMSMRFLRRLRAISNDDDVRQLADIFEEEIRRN